MKAFWRAFTMRTLALALLTTLLFMPQAYAAQTYRTLEFGSRGTEVLSLQKALEAITQHAQTLASIPEAAPQAGAILRAVQEIKE